MSDMQLSVIDEEIGSPVESVNGQEEEANNSIQNTEKKHKKHHKHSKHKHHHKESNVVSLPDISPPNTEWVRCFDAQHNIYYTNSVTGASAWLQPCCSCHKTSDRWCIDCRLPYCDHDFTKKHGKKEIKEKHRWQFKELFDPVPLQPGDEYCIACQHRAAFKMCIECWDPYCLSCFSLVHHVGALKHHKSIPYKRAKSGWRAVRDYENKTETYIHGETGETSIEKPYDLYTEEEQIILENINSHQAAAAEHKITIEKLQAEYDIVQKERDYAVVETTKAINEWRAKVETDKIEAAADAKGKKGNKNAK